MKIYINQNDIYFGKKYDKIELNESNNLDKIISKFKNINITYNNIIMMSNIIYLKEKYNNIILDIIPKLFTIFNYIIKNNIPYNNITGKNIYFNGDHNVISITNILENKNKKINDLGRILEDLIIFSNIKFDNNLVNILLNNFDGSNYINDIYIWDNIVEYINKNKYNYIIQDTQIINDGIITIPELNIDNELNNSYEFIIN